MTTPLAAKDRGNVDPYMREQLFVLEFPPGFRTELIDGEIIVSGLGTGAHQTNVSKLMKQFARHSDELLSMGGLGLSLPSAYVVPDLTVCIDDTCGGESEWSTPAGVLLVAEVSSRRTWHRDHHAKWRGYAEAGIPLYLIVDREAERVALYSHPRKDDYAALHQVAFGYKLPLPEPFNFDLDTSELR